MSESTKEKLLLRDWECCVAQGYDDTIWQQTIRATTRGKAKLHYWRGIREAWPDIPFTRIRCRSLGKAGAPLIPTPEELAQAEAEAFNRAHPVGTLMRYWSGLKEGEPTGTAAIWHPATVVSQHAVCWLQGVSSCHSLSHVEAIAP